MSSAEVYGPGLRAKLSTRYTCNIIVRVVVVGGCLVMLKKYTYLRIVNK